jgi:hypothetical protein
VSALDYDLPSYVSGIVGIIAMPHHTQLVVDGGLNLGLPENIILPISTSWVAGITNMYYYT